MNKRLRRVVSIVLIFAMIFNLNVSGALATIFGDMINHQVFAETNYAVNEEEEEVIEEDKDTEEVEAEEEEAAEVDEAIEEVEDEANSPMLQAPLADDEEEDAGYAEEPEEDETETSNDDEENEVEADENEASDINLAANAEIEENIEIEENAETEETTKIEDDIDVATDSEAYENSETLVAEEEPEEDTIATDSDAYEIEEVEEDIEEDIEATPSNAEIDTEDVVATLSEIEDIIATLSDANEASYNVIATLSEMTVGTVATLSEVATTSEIVDDIEIAVAIVETTPSDVDLITSENMDVASMSRILKAPMLLGASNEIKEFVSIDENYGADPKDQFALTATEKGEVYSDYLNFQVIDSSEGFDNVHKETKDNMNRYVEYFDGTKFVRVEKVKIFTDTEYIAFYDGSNKLLLKTKIPTDISSPIDLNWRNFRIYDKNKNKYYYLPAITSLQRKTPYAGQKTYYPYKYENNDLQAFYWFSTDEISLHNDKFKYKYNTINQAFRFELKEVKYYPNIVWRNHAIDLNTSTITFGSTYVYPGYAYIQKDCKTYAKPTFPRLYCHDNSGKPIQEKVIFADLGSECSRYIPVKLDDLMLKATVGTKTYNVFFDTTTRKFVYSKTNFASDDGIEVTPTVLKFNKIGYKFAGAKLGSDYYIDENNKVVNLNKFTTGIPTEISLTSEWKKAGITTVAFHKNIEYSVYNTYHTPEKIYYWDKKGFYIDEDATVKIDEENKLKLTALYCEGFKCSGFNTKPDGTGTSYTIDDIIKNPGDIKNPITDLYVMWTPENVQTVTLKRNTTDITTGTFPSAIYYLYNRGFFTTNKCTTKLKDEDLSKLVRTGYKYSKFSTNPDGTGDVYEISHLPYTIETFPSSLYVVWENDGIESVEIDRNGGSDIVAGSIPSKIYYWKGKGFYTTEECIDTTKVVVDDLNKLTRLSYAYTKFNTKPDGTGDNYTFADIANNTGNLKNIPKKLYAIWVKDGIKTVTLSKNASDATGTIPSKIYYWINNGFYKDEKCTTRLVASDLDTVTRISYKYTNYNTAKDATGVSYTVNDIVSNVGNLTTVPTELYIDWDMDPSQAMKVKLHTNYTGHSETVDIYYLRNFGFYNNSSCTVGFSKDYLGSYFTRTSYDISYFTKNEDGTGDAYTLDSLISNKGTIENMSADIYAQWRLKTGDMTEVLFDMCCDDYTIADPENTLRVYYREHVGFMDYKTWNESNTVARANITKPTRPGYIFKNYNTKPDGSGETFDENDIGSRLKELPEGITTLYAIWERGNVYELILNKGSINDDPTKLYVEGNIPEKVYYWKEKGLYTTEDCDVKVEASELKGLTRPSYAYDSFEYQFSSHTVHKIAIDDLVSGICSYYFSDGDVLYISWQRTTLVRPLYVKKNTSGTVTDWKLPSAIYFINGYGFYTDQYNLGPTTKFKLEDIGTPTLDDGAPYVLDSFVEGQNRSWVETQDVEGAVVHTFEDLINMNGSENPTYGLYAKWIPNPNKITIIKNTTDTITGTVSEIYFWANKGMYEKKDCKDIDKIIATTSAISGMARLGYKYSSFNTEPDGSGDRYTFDDIVAITSFDGEVPTVLYVDWEVDATKVVLDKNSSIATGSFIENIYYLPNSGFYSDVNCENELLDSDINRLKTKGYKYNSFTENEDGTGAEYTIDDLINDDGTNTNVPAKLYVKWQPAVEPVYIYANTTETVYGHIPEVIYFKNGTNGGFFKEEECTTHIVADDLDGLTYIGYHYDSFSSVSKNNPSYPKGVLSIEEIVNNTGDLSAIGIPDGLYVLWKQDPYPEITFDNNTEDTVGGTELPEKIYYIKDKGFYKSSDSSIKVQVQDINGLTREGYKYTKFNTSSDGSGDKYTFDDIAGNPIVASVPNTFYVMWEKDGISTIMIDKNAQETELSGSILDKIYHWKDRGFYSDADCETKVKADDLNQITRTGYTYQSFFSNGDTINEYIIDDIVSDTGTIASLSDTIYISWTPDKKVYNLNKNGGDKDYKLYVYYNEGISYKDNWKDARANLITKISTTSYIDWYECTGYYDGVGDDANLIIPYPDGDLANISTTFTNTDAVKLYAKFDYRVAKITLDDNSNGENVIKDLNEIYQVKDDGVYKVASHTESKLTNINIPKRTAYKFYGYATIDDEGNAVTTYIDENGKVNIPVNTFAEDTTLYAIWDKDPASIKTITLNKNATDTTTGTTLPTNIYYWNTKGFFSDAVCNTKVAKASLSQLKRAGYLYTKFSSTTTGTGTGVKTFTIDELVAHTGDKALTDIPATLYVIWEKDPASIKAITLNKNATDTTGNIPASIYYWETKGFYSDATCDKKVIAASLSQLKRNGYEYSKFNTAMDGTGTEFTIDNIVADTGLLTDIPNNLYVMWEMAGVEEIKLHKNATDTTESLPEKVYYWKEKGIYTNKADNECTGKLTDADINALKRAHYTYTAFNTADDITGTEFTIASLVADAGNLTTIPTDLYVDWTPDRKVYNLDKNGGDKDYTIYAYYNSGISYKDNWKDAKGNMITNISTTSYIDWYECTGYYDGVADDANVVIPYPNGQLSNISTTFTNNDTVNLYAHYNYNVVKITLDDNADGEYVKTEVDNIYQVKNAGVYKVVSHTEPKLTNIAIPKRTYYRFMGYATYSELRETGNYYYIDNNGNVNIPTNAFTEDTTLYAIWEKDKKIITLDFNNGTGEKENIYLWKYEAYSDEKLETLIEHINIPTYEGNAFTGYYKYSYTTTGAKPYIDKNGYLSPDFTYQFIYDATLYALWVPNTIKIYIDMKDGNPKKEYYYNAEKNAIFTDKDCKDETKQNLDELINSRSGVFKGFFDETMIGNKDRKPYVNEDGSINAENFGELVSTKNSITIIPDYIIESLNVVFMKGDGAFTGENSEDNAILRTWDLHDATFALLGYKDIVKENQVLIGWTPEEDINKIAYVELNETFVNNNKKYIKNIAGIDSIVMIPVFKDYSIDTVTYVKDAVLNVNVVNDASNTIGFTGEISAHVFKINSTSENFTYNYLIVDDGNALVNYAPSKIDDILSYNIKDINSSNVVYLKDINKEALNWKPSMDETSIYTSAKLELLTSISATNTKLIANALSDTAGIYSIYVNDKVVNDGGDGITKPQKDDSLLKLVNYKYKENGNEYKIDETYVPFNGYAPAKYVGYKASVSELMSSILVNYYNREIGGVEEPDKFDFEHTAILEDTKLFAHNDQYVIEYVKNGGDWTETRGDIDGYDGKEKTVLDKRIYKSDKFFDGWTLEDGNKDLIVSEIGSDNVSLWKVFVQTEAGNKTIKLYALYSDYSEENIEKVSDNKAITFNIIDNEKETLLNGQVHISVDVYKTKGENDSYYVLRNYHENHNLKVDDILNSELETEKGFSWKLKALDGDKLTYLIDKNGAEKEMNKDIELISLKPEAKDFVEHICIASAPVIYVSAKGNIININTNEKASESTVARIDSHKIMAYDGMPYGTLPESIERDGYIFVGYNTKEDGTGTTITRNDICNKSILDGNTIYVIWQPKQYEVKIDDTIGTYTGPTQFTVSFDHEYDFGIPTRVGHAFDKWHVDDGNTYFNNGNRWTLERENGDDRAFVLTAVWREPYTVSFFREKPKASAAGGGGRPMLSSAMYTSPMLGAGFENQYELIGNVYVEDQGVVNEDMVPVLKVSSTSTTDEVVLEAELNDEQKKVYEEVKNDIVVREKEKEVKIATSSCIFVDKDDIDTTLFKVVKLSDGSSKLDRGMIRKPTREGYKFAGYKVGTTLCIDADGFIIESAVMGLVKDDDTVAMESEWTEITYNDVKITINDPNKYIKNDIVYTYNKSDATGNNWSLTVGDIIQKNIFTTNTKNEIISTIEKSFARLTGFYDETGATLVFDQDGVITNDGRIFLDSTIDREVVVYPSYEEAKSIDICFVEDDKFKKILVFMAGDGNLYYYDYDDLTSFKPESEAVAKNGETYYSNNVAYIEKGYINVTEIKSILTATDYDRCTVLNCNILQDKMYVINVGEKDGYTLKDTAQQIKVTLHPDNTYTLDAGTTIDLSTYDIEGYEFKGLVTYTTKALLTIDASGKTTTDYVAVDNEVIDINGKVNVDTLKNFSMSTIRVFPKWVAKDILDLNVEGTNNTVNYKYWKGKGIFNKQNLSDTSFTLTGLHVNEDIGFNSYTVKKLQNILSLVGGKLSKGVIDGTTVEVIDSDGNFASDLINGSKDLSSYATDGVVTIKLITDVLKTSIIFKNGNNEAEKFTVYLKKGAKINESNIDISSYDVSAYKNDGVGKAGENFCGYYPDSEENYQILDSNKKINTKDLVAYLLDINTQISSNNSVEIILHSIYKPANVVTVNIQDNVGTTHTFRYDKATGKMKDEDKEINSLYEINTFLNNFYPNWTVPGMKHNVFASVTANNIEVIGIDGCITEKGKSYLNNLTLTTNLYTTEYTSSSERHYGDYIICFIGDKFYVFNTVDNKAKIYSDIDSAIFEILGKAKYDSAKEFVDTDGKVIAKKVAGKFKLSEDTLDEVYNQDIAELKEDLLISFNDADYNNYQILYDRNEGKLKLVSTILPTYINSIFDIKDINDLYNTNNWDMSKKVHNAFLGLTTDPNETKKEIEIIDCNGVLTADGKNYLDSLELTTKVVELLVNGAQTKLEKIYTKGPTGYRICFISKDLIYVYNISKNNAKVYTDIDSAIKSMIGSAVVPDFVATDGDNIAYLDKATNKYVYYTTFTID